MKKSGQRTLSFLLTIVMVLSMLVIPAAADDELRTKWDYRNWDKDTTWADDEKVIVQSGTATISGLEIDASASGAKYDGRNAGSNWIQVNGGTIIKIPVAVPEGNVAVLTAEFYSAGAFEVDDVANKSGGGKKDADTFTCAGTDGYITVKALKNDYIGYLSVSYEEGTIQPTLSLSEEIVQVKVDDEDMATATVTATVNNGTATAWDVEVNADPAGAATATVAGGEVTITAVAEGTATVTVKATVDGADDPVTADIAVTVLPAGEVVYTSWDFTAQDWTAAEKVNIQGGTGTLRGLEIDATASQAKFSGSQIGGSWVQFNKDTIIKVPVNVPDGKKALVTVKTYAVNTISVEGVPNQKANANEEFVCLGEDGWVTIKGLGGQGYLASISVDYGEGELVSVVELDKDYLGLQMGETESGEITVTKIHSDAAVKAVSADETVAKTTVDGDKVTITAVGAGETTVDISLDGVAETALNKKSVTVEVGAAGQVYYIEEGTYDFTGYTADNIGSIKGLDTHGAVPQDASPSHGLQETGAGAGTSGTATGKIELTVNIPEGRTADLIFVTCRFGIGTELLMTSSSGKVTKTETSVDSATGLQFTVAGASGETTLTFHIPEGKDPEGNDWNKGIWIHSMSVLFGAQKDEDRKIDVWDLTGQVVTGDKYNNNITPELWKDKGYAVSGVLSNGTEITAGDFTLIHNTNDRLYSSVANAADFGAQTSSYGKWDYDDGYKPAGGIYCNGSGSATARYIQVKNVFPGDKLVAYMGSAQNGDVPFVFEGLGSAAAQEKMTHTVAVSTYEKMEFVAEQTGTYKIWASGGGKPMYQRVVRYPGVPVSGAITLPEGYDGPSEYGIKFVNKSTKAVTLAEVKDNRFEVTLAPGYEYSAIMTGAAGWGFSVATKTVETAEDGGVGVDAGMTHNMTVEAKSTYVFSGSFVGFADGYDISKLAVELTAEEGSGSDDAELTITGKTFTATLDPEVTYTLTLLGVNDYSLKSGSATVYSDTGDLTRNIEVEAKPLVAASGKFVTLDVDDQFAPLYANSAYEPLTAEVTALSFKNVEDGYTYTATVADGGYTANLRAGAYEAVATVNGWSTKGHVVVADKAVEKDLMFVSKATPAAVDYAADIYVDGKGGSNLHFKTVTGAMAYIKRMTRADDQRVTVHITPGTYREQISIDSKNVTFVNADPAREVKLTWYYGIGYDYYSAGGGNNLDSWYDAQNAFDKYTTPGMDVARWGCTVRVQAPGFQAQDITFENSFNYYLTEEEVLDGVVPNGAQNINFAREYGADVTSKAATERAAAIWVDTNSGRGDMTEFKNCKFLSSQDTFGTGKRMYLKDCYIEGMTDYICGPGDVVFDTCTLNWKGYSDTATGGYLTAPQTGTSEKGYLFRNCYISGDTKLKLTGGALGRTWGAANTKCIYLNTILQSADLINNASWVEMQGFNPANSSTLLEWGTTLLDGTAVDLSKRTLQNTVAKTEPTAKPTDYFGDWTPMYYMEEDEVVAFEVEPAITDNGDINTPYPGHTLTVNYSLGEKNDANDASVIKWVRVDADGTETVVKTSKANADKTYKITKDDQGAIIKVTVTPTTLSGKTAEPKSIALENKVREGFEDPTGTTDPELGDGVNVFLAGDSTVFDYKGRNEGSWGEFLQNYLNKDLVTVVNHAVGGRSSRSFINEGRLDAIAANIKEGDYLLIQFGHNDCANETDYRVERYAPLGNADANGVYPTTAGTKGSDGKYTWDCGGTYKWYLQQYIDVAKKAGATPILVTPVARLYYTADGTIRPHHDASYATNGSVTDTSKWDTAKDNTKYSNTYVTAVKQLAEENGIACIDAFQFTKDLYEDAYKACEESDKATYGRQVMHSGDSTHSNKLGGMIQAALMAQAIKDLDVSISKTVKAPTMAQANTTKGKTVFTVDGKGVFTAYDMLKDYGQTAPYWMGVGQDLMDALKDGSSGEPADKTALNKAVKDAEAALAAATVAEDGSQVATDKTWITAADKATLQKAIADAKALGDDATATQVSNALKAVNNAVKAIKAGEKEETSSGGGSGSGRPAIGQTTTPGGETSTTASVTNPDGTVATSTTDKDGNMDITVKGEDGEVLAEVKLPATISAPATKFIDVPEGHWAEKSINNMAGLGMVKGVSEDTYDMVSPITRGAVATILFRLSNGAEGKTSTFADVSADAWYADAVGWAANAKLINGYNEISFGPEDTITRQQLAVMISRYARLLGMDTAANAVALDAFVDGSAADDWAVASLAWCVKNGVMKGRGGDVLDPTAAVTRAEAAVMIDRMIGLIK